VKVRSRNTGGEDGIRGRIGEGLTALKRKNWLFPIYLNALDWWTNNKGRMDMVVKNRKMIAGTQLGRRRAEVEVIRKGDMVERWEIMG